MKRRDLLKTMLCTIPVSAVGLFGCKKDDSKISKSDKIKIVPKQTDVYKFSSPLVFNHEFIDEMAGYNAKYKKSQVEVLYNNLPWPASSKFNEWFQTKRGENPDIKSFDDFASYAKHAMDNGFKICYLINSPKPFNSKDIAPVLKDFYKLLDDIYNAGIRQIKIANTQVAELISNYNKEFELTASVCLEYHSTTQYKYLIEHFPNIKRIVITKDENQNFKLLKNLRTMFPDKEIEVMLNENCVKNCPSRFFCMSDSETTNIGNHIGCKFSQKYPYISFYENGVVHPWQLDYYSAIGINYFKVVQSKNRAIDKNNMALKKYMEFTEYGFGSEEARKYITESFGMFRKNLNNVDISSLLSYFPDMDYFVKNGHKCNKICGVECNYCKERAEELKKFLDNYT